MKGVKKGDVVRVTAQWSHREGESFPVSAVLNDSILCKISDCERIRLKQGEFILVQPPVNPAESEDVLDPKAALRDCTMGSVSAAQTGPISIETVPRINGRDASSFTDNELYDLIRSEEQKIANLDAIKNKPKRLLDEIAARNKGISDLVAFMDSK